MFCVLEQRSDHIVIDQTYLCPFSVFLVCNYSNQTVFIIVKPLCASLQWDVEWLLFGDDLQVFSPPQKSLMELRSGLLVVLLVSFINDIQLTDNSIGLTL